MYVCVSMFDALSDTADFSYGSSWNLWNNIWVSGNLFDFLFFLFFFFFFFFLSFFFCFCFCFLLSFCLNDRFS
jgi:hypothetical protein